MAVIQPDSTQRLPVKGARPRAVAQHLWQALARALQLEEGRITIWSPVFLVAGIWLYFALASEPAVLLSAVLASLAAALLVFTRRRRAVLLLVLVIAGFCLAQLRTSLVATPLLRAYTPDVALAGTIADVDRRSAARLVLVIDVERVGGLPDTEIPRRVRVQLTAKNLAPQIGDHIAGTATLLPLPLPVAPNTFDYGRSLFFQSVGATGYFTRPVALTTGDTAYRYRLRRTFHTLRSAIGERIRAIIPGPLGSFADALVTGERAAIPRAMNQSLQASGLFHILSISGLHMTLVVGSAFWAVRAFLALFASLALVYPIKKWAAGAALAVGLFYMLLADSGAATERSFVMIAIMLFAMMVDRPAISLHNLAIAAILILVAEPEQAIAASFQMSFLAVMGLAAFFEWWNSRTQMAGTQHQGMLWRSGRWLMLLIAGSLLTSLIAGGLSGIAAAHHFGRLAPYGIFANALALPVVGIAVMPMALLATILMPFGLEELPLHVMAHGLTVVMWISDWVASWPHANLLLPKLAGASAAMLAGAAVLLCIPVSRLRLLALPLVAAGLVTVVLAQRPDILVDERGRTVAARSEEGLLVPVTAPKAGFSVAKWLQDDGDTETPKAASRRALWTCDQSVCTTTSNGTTVAYLRDTAAIVKPCPAADIIVAQYPLRRKCKGQKLTIDRFDVWRNGAYAIAINSGTLAIETARGVQGKRPWSFAPRARAKPPGK